MSAFLTIAIIHALAVMSPGPDFILVTKNTLETSRRAGVFTAIGLGLGILVHVSYSLLGIGLLISQSIVFFNTIKWIGAAYLIYLGWGALTHQSKNTSGSEKNTIGKKHLSAGAAMRMGFLCNVLNPKASLFFLALFTQVIRPETPPFVQIVYGLYMSIATIIWFSFVSHFLGTSMIRRQFEKIQSVFTRAMGAVLLALGIKIALSSRR